MWSKPTNLGSIVNSYSDEVGFSMIADGTKGYVSSNRIGIILNIPQFLLLKGLVLMASKMLMKLKMGF